MTLVRDGLCTSESTSVTLLGRILRGNMFMQVEYWY